MNTQPSATYTATGIIISNGNKVVTPLPNNTKSILNNNNTEIENNTKVNNDSNNNGYNTNLNTTMSISKQLAKNNNSIIFNINTSILQLLYINDLYLLDNLSLTHNIKTYRFWKKHYIQTLNKLPKQRILLEEDTTSFLRFTIQYFRYQNISIEQEYLSAQTELFNHTLTLFDKELREQVLSKFQSVHQHYLSNNTCEAQELGLIQYIDPNFYHVTHSLIKYLDIIFNDVNNNNWEQRQSNPHLDNLINDYYDECDQVYLPQYSINNQTNLINQYNVIDKTPIPQSPNIIDPKVNIQEIKEEVSLTTYETSTEEEYSESSNNSNSTTNSNDVQKTQVDKQDSQSKHNIISTLSCSQSQIYELLEDINTDTISPSESDSKNDVTLQTDHEQDINNNDSESELVNSNSDDVICNVALLNTLDTPSLVINALNPIKLPMLTSQEGPIHSIKLSSNQVINKSKHKQARNITYNMLLLKELIYFTTTLTTTIHIIYCFINNTYVCSRYVWDPGRNNKFNLRLLFHKLNYKSIHNYTI